MIRDSFTILVVDDMKFSCEFIRRALKKEGYNSVKVVNSSPEALMHLEEHPVDVVLADWLMPEMDGLELAQRIRQLDEENHHYTGIVLLTAKDDITSIRTAFEEGVDDYIVKPPNQIELAARIYSAGRVATMQNDLLMSTQTLHKLFENKCTVDKITGLGRIEDTQNRLSKLLNQTHSRGGVTCCAILKVMDIDKVVTSYGQKVQEQIMNSISTRICRHVRPMDLVGHAKIDEFLIAMYNDNSDNVRCRHFKRILHDINRRAYKTSSGFINIHCAMAMTITHKDDQEHDVREFINITREKLHRSIETGFEEVAS